eukprot:5360052-Prymnesium_polylepis.1
MFKERSVQSEVCMKARCTKLDQENNIVVGVPAMGPKKRSSSLAHCKAEPHREDEREHGLDRRPELWSNHTEADCSGAKDAQLEEHDRGQASARVQDRCSEALPLRSKIAPM